MHAGALMYVYAYSRNTENRLIKNAVELTKRFGLVHLCNEISTRYVIYNTSI